MRILKRRVLSFPVDFFEIEVTSYGDCAIVITSNSYLFINFPDAFNTSILVEVVWLTSIYIATHQGIVISH